MGRSWVILILLMGSVSAQEPFFNFGEGFSIAENQDATSGTGSTRPRR